MKNKLYTFLIVFFAITFALSGTVVVYYSYHSAKQDSAYREIIDKVESDAQKENIELVPFDDDEYFLPEYYNLYLENNDLAGWIKIDGTKINYPVMQSIGRIDYYIRKDFNKEYAFHGIPYIQENCKLRTGDMSDNIIIYAHNMDDGSMFGGLEDYLKKDFWENHKTIYFDTLTLKGEYEVMSVFTTTASTADSDRFKYHLFVDASSETEFNEFVNNCKRLQRYDTGVTAEYGDKLITLSTCEYTREHGRLVVVARRVN